MVTKCSMWAELPGMAVAMLGSASNGRRWLSTSYLVAMKPLCPREYCRQWVSVCMCFAVREVPAVRLEISCAVRSVAASIVGVVVVPGNRLRVCPFE